MYTGPNFNHRDLVFGIDTGFTSAGSTSTSSTRHFKGEPTVNLAPSDFANWGTEGSAQRILTENTYEGQPTYNCRTTVGESWRGIDTTVSGLRTSAGSSGTVTMSCMVRNNNASAYSMYAYVGYDFGSTRVIPANGIWQKIQWTVNVSSMLSDYVEFRPYTNSDTIYLEMTKPQVEINKGHATTYTETSRSNTNSLLDLSTNKHPVNVSNISFDGDAMPVFDGTDDVIDITSNLGIHSSYTFEYVAQSNAGSKMPIGSRNATSFYRYGGSSWRYTHGGTGGEFYTPTGGKQTGWMHTVIVYSGYSLTVYENNIVLGTTTPTNGTADFSAGLRIGTWASSSSYTWNGIIPVLKMYSRALLAEEVAHNFNIYKNRFDF